MNTLAQLRTGALHGAVSLKLSEDLSHFPGEIFSLADTLQVLDLSGNKLTELPADFGRLKNLRILFCSDNLFTSLPEVLADCPLLDIVGFKANRIAHIPPQSLNANIRWLILTDNRITDIPVQIGNCLRMQKLMLAGNRLITLPSSLSNCRNLSLLRISANRLTSLPRWLLAMPRLSWLAFSGNDFSTQPPVPALPVILWNQLEVRHTLGQGASGVIYKGETNYENETRHIAIKIFKGAVTSDGLPADEMNAFISAGDHPALVRLIAQIAGHPEDKMGLAMELIADHFYNLGMPPTFETCTRDVFSNHISLSPVKILKIAASIASLACQLHDRGIMHGDLYAHNILVDDQGNTLLGDFGAASFYDKSDAAISHNIERIEVSAFGYLLEDLLGRCNNAHPAIEKLETLRNACLAENVLSRPSFRQINTTLATLRHTFFPSEA